MSDNTNRMIDTHAAVKDLTDAGMPEVQAEAVVAIQRDLLENQAASKYDLEKLEASLRGEIQDVRNDLEKLEASLRGEIQDVRNDLEKLEASLRGDMEKLEASLRGDMEKLEASLRGDMEKLEASLRSEIQDVRNDLGLLRKDMEALGSYLLTRLGVLMVVGGGFIIGLLEFLR